MNFIKHRMRKLIGATFLIAGIFALASCGGGGGGGGGTPTAMSILPPPPSTLPADFPPAIPANSPPQASGSDIPNVVVAGQGSTSTLRVHNGGGGPVTYQSGQYLEPRDGDYQRMIVTRSTTINPGDTGNIPVACRQVRKSIPATGLRFFSSPKATTGTVGACQIACVNAGGSNVQNCVWGCETSPPPSSRGQIQFTLTDGCSDPGALEARFFGYVGTSTAGRPDYVWPSSNRVYTTGNRRTTGESIQVTLGESGSGIGVICYGAKLENDDSSYWGVGLDGDQGCSDCCTRVPSSGTTRVSRNLVCR